MKKEEPIKKKSNNDKQDLTRHEERHAFESARKKIREAIDRHLPSEQINLNTLDELKLRLESDLLAEVYGEMLFAQAIEKCRLEFERIQALISKKGA